MKKLSVALLASLLTANYAAAQAFDPRSFSISTPRPINPATNSTNPNARAGQSQNPYLGSTPEGKATDGVISLTLQETIARGLRYNLGLIESNQASVEARAQRVRALSKLLPQISAQGEQAFERLSLKEIGLKLPPIPGFRGLPSVTDNFGFQDARVSLSQTLYSAELRSQYRAERAAAQASSFEVRDARDVVVYVVGTAYLQVVASRARLESTKAQLTSAQALDQQAVDQVGNEVSPEIDSLRSRVERQTAEQRVINATNELEKDKLTLARITGIPMDQRFEVAAEVRYQPVTATTQAAATEEALRSRSDLASAETTVKAAEYALRAKKDERLPTVAINADYGGGGVNVGNFDQVFTVAGRVSLPIFTGGRIHADIEQARSELARRKAEYQDLRGRVAYDVRVAWLDLQSSDSSVKVAESNKELADRALAQALDRYKNGVTNYLEVVQAQETLAGANQNYIDGLYSRSMWPSFRWLAPPGLLKSTWQNSLEETEMSQSTLELEDVVVRESVHAPGNAASKDPRKPSTSKRLRPFLIFGLLPLVLVTGLLLWLHYRHFETTDDAQIDGHVNSISTRISGTVTWVNPKVVNNQYVEAGTLLFQLDPNDYQVALEQAHANLTTREATASAAQVNVPITNASAFSQLRLASAGRAEAEATQQFEEANLSIAEHKVQLDEAVAARAERDRVRYEALVQKHEIALSEYDARETEAHSAHQTLEADRSAVIAARQNIAAARSRLAQKQAEVDSARTAPQQVTDAQARFKSSSGQVQQAQADVHAAELNLSYTKIYAPVSGIIGRKTIELGQRVQQGQSLLAIVPVDDIWVTANFKETQLQLMRPGQAVTIHVDSFGHDYQGTVENVAGAAGTLFSLLPPENANGNFVKVVQRMPVRIRFNAGEDPQHLLRPGMSTESTVKVR